MCGIAGFFQRSLKEPKPRLRAMTDAIAYRGPDDQGAWIDDEAGIALGHRRLSILDLSPQGHQPMHSASGRYVIVFNGEVYNYRLLASALRPRGHEFRGGSDTEVMLAAFEEWGVEAALSHFNGMFACGVWDRQERLLYLFRDRLGIKPLYYGWHNGLFLFASELKSLTAHPLSRPAIDRKAVSAFLRFSYVPAPFSIYEDFFKLPQGTILKLSFEDLCERPGQFSPHGGQAGSCPKPFWSAQEIVRRACNDPFQGSVQEALGVFDDLLKDSVQLRMIADVPLGAFLSGGIDSSLVVALMQAQSTQPVRTFTIGFHEDAYNEALWAKKVAQHIGTDHTELYLTAQEAMDVIPSLPRLYDEPFADASQIPTFLVSRLARQKVTVSLSGDGGDELFAGYNRYVWASRIWETLRLVPHPLRCVAGKALCATPQRWLDTLFGLLKPLRRGDLNFHSPGYKLQKLGALAGLPDQHALYRKMVSHWSDPASIVLDGEERGDLLQQPTLWPPELSYLQQMMFLDLVTYLPDDILVKVDRASMAVALEARVPLLDYRVVEFAWRLPARMKFRDGQSKWLLRQLLYKYVPRELIERPKMGFGVPIGEWLRGPLRGWAEDLLSRDRLQREGYLRPEPVREKWEQHLSGKQDWQYYLWDVLMFEAWLSSAGA